MNRHLSFGAFTLATAVQLGMAHAADGPRTKQWFNEFDYQKDKGSDIGVTSISSRYYFAPQSYAGVWDEFGYLDTDSKVEIAYTDDDLDDVSSAGAEVFVTEKWFIDASAEDLAHLDTDYLLGTGYLYDEKLKLTLYHQEAERSVTGLKAEYNHMLDDVDYLGVTLESQNGDELWILSSRYFRQMWDNQYFSLDIEHIQIKDKAVGNDSTSVLVNYYFGTHFALGGGSVDSDVVLQAKFFVSDDFYLVGQYTDVPGGDVAQLSLVAQF